MNQSPHFCQQISAYITDHPRFTYYIRISDRSMIGVGLFPDDIVVVDCMREAQYGDTIFACVNGGYVVRIWESGSLVAIGQTRVEYPMTEQMTIDLIGVVVTVIRRLRW